MSVRGGSSFVVRLLDAWARPFLLSLIVFVSGCESPSTSAPANSRSWLALERTAGSMTESPVYVVTLYRDGGVLFEGRANVKSKGTFAKHISPAKAAEIFSRLEAIDFWDRPPRYDEERMRQGGDEKIVAVASRDVPWDIISARHNGRFKRIDGLFYAPRDVIDLKKLVEETVGLADWIGTPNERKS